MTEFSFGTHFDDDLFSSKEPARNVCEKQYEPRFCYKTWFYNEAGDPAEEIGMWKFRADHSYHAKKYEDAFKHYDHLLEIVPESNLPVKRDVLEAISRCCLKQGRAREALDYACRLHETSKTNDHLTVSCGLLAETFRELEEHQKELTMRQRLLKLHPYNDTFWVHVGTCYMELHKKSRVCDCHWSFLALSAAASWVRAAVILESVRGTVKSFVLKRNQDMQVKLHGKLEQMDLPPDFIRRCREVMSLDIYGEDTDDVDFKDFSKGRDGGGADCWNGGEKEFEGKWFQWISRESWCCSHGNSKEESCFLG